MKSSKYMQHLYDVMTIVSEYPFSACALKLVTFFAVSTLVELNTEVVMASNAIVYMSVGSTVLLVLACVLTLSTARRSFLHNVATQLFGLLLFLNDYLFYPFKSIELIMFVGVPVDTVRLAVAAVDYVASTAILLVQLKYGRHFDVCNPTVLTVFNNEFESLLLVATGVRLMLSVFSTSPVARAFYTVCLFATSVALLLVFVRQRPFVDSRIESLVGVLVATQVNLLCVRSVTSSISATLVVASFTLPASIVLLRAGLKLDDARKMSSKLSSVYCVRHLLLDLPYSTIGVVGELKMALLKQTVQHNQYRRARLRDDDAYEGKRLDNNASELSLTHVPIEVIVKPPPPPVKPNSAVEPQTPRLKSINSSILIPKVEVATAVKQMVFKHYFDEAIKREQLEASSNPHDVDEYNTMLISRHLDGNDAYKLYLKLVWTLKHKFTLGVVLAILARLRVLAFKTVHEQYFYHVSLRDVERRLVELDHPHNQSKQLCNIKLNDVPAPSKLPTRRNHRRQTQYSTVSELVKVEVKSGVRSRLNHTLAFDEYVDISQVFYYKSLIKQLADAVLDYSNANKQYIDMLAVGRLDLHPRIDMCSKLYRKNDEVSKLFAEASSISSKHDFQHLIVYYYHTFYNSNRHVDSVKIKHDINERFKVMKHSDSHRNKDIFDVSLVNDCVSLLIETQKQRFGEIVDVYGRTDMILEEPKSVIGEHYTIFMNGSLRDFHESLTSYIFDTQLGQPDSLRMQYTRVGFVKIPNRNIIIPATVLMAVCPFYSNGFKFMVAIKPDFSDEKLYIAVDNRFRVDSYSSSFLSVCSESYLKNGIPLSKLNSKAANNMKHLNLQLEHERTNAAELSSKASSPKNTPRRTPSPTNKAQTKLFMDSIMPGLLKILEVVEDTINFTLPTLTQTNANYSLRECFIEDKLRLVNIRSEADYLEKNFKMLIRHHTFSRAGDGSKGYWYLCLSQCSEKDVMRASRPYLNLENVESGLEVLNTLKQTPSEADKKDALYSLNRNEVEQDANRLTTGDANLVTEFAESLQEDEVVDQQPMVDEEATPGPGLPTLKKSAAGLDRLSKVNNHRKQLEAIAQQIYGRRAFNKSTRIVHGDGTKGNFNNDTKLYKPNEQVNRMIQQVLDKKKISSVLRSALFLYFSTCVLIILLSLGLNWYMFSISDTYRQFLGLHLSISQSILDLKTLNGNVIRSEALINGLVNLDRYTPMGMIDPASSVGKFKGNYFLWNQDRRMSTVKRILDSARILRSAAMDLTTKDFMTNQQLYKITLFYVDDKSIRQTWDLFTAYTLYPASMVNKFLMPLQTKGFPIANLNELYTDFYYLTNELIYNSETVVQVLHQQTTEMYFKALSVAQMLILALIVFIALLLLANLAGLCLTISKFARVHRMYGYATQQDIAERYEQLSTVTRVLEHMRFNEYYICNKLEEFYCFSSNTLLKRSSDVRHREARASKSVFVELKVSMFCLTGLYLLMGVVCLAVYLTLKLQISEMKWIEEKKQLGEHISFKYIDYYNQVTQYLVLGDRFPFEGKNSTVFFKDYDIFIEDNMKKLADLASMYTESSTRMNKPIYDYIQSLYNSDVCDQTGTDYAKICRNIDNNVGRQGLSQIEKRVRTMLVEVYNKMMLQKLTPFEIMNTNDFIEGEFAATKYYFQLFTKVYTTIVQARSSFVGSTMLKSIIYFSVATVLIVLLAMSLASIPFYKFNKATQIVNFSFTLLSLHSYVTNFHLKKSISTTLRIKQTFLAES